MMNPRAARAHRFYCAAVSGPPPHAIKQRPTEVAGALDEPPAVSPRPSKQTSPRQPLARHTSVIVHPRQEGDHVAQRAHG
jgi:hypothetical protein